MKEGQKLSCFQKMGSSDLIGEATPALAGAGLQRQRFRNSQEKKR